VAFCPHCGAPQIRVAAAVAEHSVTPAFPPGTPGDVQPPARPVGLAPASPGAIDWSQGVRASALAGLLLALAIFFVPVIVAGIGLVLHLGQGAIGLLVLLASWCCMLAAGALAVRFYRRRRPGTTIRPGVGARLGVMSGLLGFFLYSVPQALRLAFFHLGGSVREAMQKAIEQSAAQSPDPKAQELMRNLMSPGVLAAFLTFLVVLFFLVFLVLSSLGGAIGASIWGGKESS
jgi:hypothetical protein